MNVTRQTFLPLFNEMDLLGNAVCRSCDAPVRFPLLPWFVGSRFAETEKRLVFVGKPHRGIIYDQDDPRILNGKYIDPTDVVENRFWNERWSYWRYTRTIAKRLYGPGAIDHIAMTNIIKCTGVDSEVEGTTAADRTSECMARSCITELGMIWEELKLLEARTVVFYTYALWPELLVEVPIATTDVRHERNERRACGRKSLGWWEREYTTAWTDRLRLLVVGHPERMHLDDYVGLLTDWISRKG